MKNYFMPLNRNIILDCDSYKNNHGQMLPNNTLILHSSIIFRKPNEFTSFVKFFGLQYVLKNYLSQKITIDMINEAEQEITEQGYYFDRKRWEYILNEYKGALPLVIKSIPEGTVIPIGIPVLTIENTDYKCAWLSSYVETMLQRAIWKMTTVATISFDLYNYLNEVMFKHTGELNKVNFHLHNFGSRGADSYESDIMSGMAHLTSGFMGSDCLQANRNIKHFYNTKTPYASSVLASEHSIMCANSNNEDRDDYHALVKMLDLLEFNILNKIGTPIVSIVADTYDIFRFCEEYIGQRLKNRIENLGKLGGRIVIRPDSGDPKVIPIDVIKMLMNSFGYSTNKYGYKVLPEFIRVLQGDGINQNSIREIILELEKNKFSLENLFFGMGGGLTHEAGRDEFSCAMKATAILLDENGKHIWKDLFKDPITDISKRSPKGRISTFINHKNEVFYERCNLIKYLPNGEIKDLMNIVFKNGEILNEISFEEVKQNNLSKF